MKKIIKYFIRDLEINKLRKFCAVIFSISKAKFFRIAELLSKILTQLRGKRTSKMRRLLFAKSLNAQYLYGSSKFNSNRLKPVIRMLRNRPIEYLPYFRDILFKIPVATYMLFFFLIIIFGCHKEAPAYNISDDKMVLIMADIHISEAAVQHLSFSMKDSIAKIYLTQILAIHKIPREKFEPEYQRLKKDPDKLEIIYTKVIARLNDLKLRKTETEIKKKK